MPISDYLAGLRAHVGPGLVLMPGVSALIRDAEGRVLLQRRADDGEWGLPSGAVDPGETPAQAVAREVWEETGLRVEAVAVRAVFGGERFRFTYPNGDVTEYTVIVFECRVLSGHLEARDGESLELRWCSPADLPPLKAPYPLEVFTPEAGPAWFERTG